MTKQNPQNRLGITRIAVASFVVLCSLTSQAQFKNDNVKYKTVFLEDLCNSLSENSGYLLLDVRSIREYGDSSKVVNYNIGRLKNAINIDVSELPTRLGELKAYKDKPVYVYCSHSARSRVASELLIDSGFSKVNNINGGMTEFNLLETEISCASTLYETANKFKLLSPLELIASLKQNEDVVVIDIRKDSVYRGISSDEKLNAYGRIKQSVNFLMKDLGHVGESFPKNHSIIFVDDAGVESRAAAAELINQGFSNVSILFNGMAAWAETRESELPEKEKYWVHPSTYSLISPDDFDKLATEKKICIVDVRPADEFTNTSKTYWRNRGNIKNAVNIPFADLSARKQELEKFKKVPIVIYHFGSHKESFMAAKQLKQAGFKTVYVLLGGITELRWRAANIKGKSRLKDWVENIPKASL